MAVFKEKTKSRPVISTAALPDIVFILLFFFMVVTVFRKDDPLVKTRYPQATQSEKIKDKSLIISLYVGFPKEKRHGEEPRISVGDYYISAEEIPQYIESQKNQIIAQKRPKVIVNLKVDRGVKMGIIQDVKQALRRVDTRKINYETVNGLEEI